MAAGSNPLSHVVQHPIVTTEADLGPLTPNGEITLLSDHITMIIAAGLLLTLFLPPLFRRRKTDDDSLEGMVPKGFANGMEAICQYLRKEVAEPALGEYTDRFIKYIWSTFFFILTINLWVCCRLPPSRESSACTSVVPLLPTSGSPGPLPSPHSS